MTPGKHIRQQLYIHLNPFTVKANGRLFTKQQEIGIHLVVDDGVMYPMRIGKLFQYPLVKTVQFDTSFTIGSQIRINLIVMGGALKVVQPLIQ